MCVKMLFMELLSTAGGSLLASEGRLLSDSAEGRREDGMGGRRAWLDKDAALSTSLFVILREEVEPMPVLLSPLCNTTKIQFTHKLPRIMSMMESHTFGNQDSGYSANLATFPRMKLQNLKIQWIEIYGLNLQRQIQLNPNSYS